MTKKFSKKVINNYIKNKKQVLVYQWGVWITAWARHELFKGILEIDEDVIYCDTDSIKFLNYENYKKHHDDEITLNSDNTRLWEMLYVDFIIRNMSKLYYKPKYNNTNDRWNGNGEAGRNLVYHLSIPYDNNGNPIVLNDKTWGWDNTEYNLFKTNDSNTNLTNENVMNERDKNNPQKNAINNEKTK